MNEDLKSYLDNFSRFLDLVSLFFQDLEQYCKDVIDSCN